MFLRNEASIPAEIREMGSLQNSHPQTPCLKLFTQETVGEAASVWGLPAADSEIKSETQRHVTPFPTRSEVPAMSRLCEPTQGDGQGSGA